MKNNPAMKRKIFIAIMLTLTGIILLFGISRIRHTQSQFGAASSTVRDMGILSRKIVSHTSDLQFAENEKAYLETMRKVRSLVREMEIKHLSLFKGNPGFTSEANFAGEIKMIYYAPAVNAVVQVREFLNHATFLLEVPYTEFTPRSYSMRYLKNAVQGSLTQMVNQTIHAYRSKRESLVYRQSGILIVSLLFVLIIAFLRYINLLRLQQPSLVYRKAKKSPASAVTVLKDISHGPVPQKVREPVNTNGQFPVSNRFPRKKKPVITPIRINADATM